MNLRTRVLNAIVGAYPNTLTNAQLSTAMGSPEPSIRRVTLELDRAGDIRAYFQNSQTGKIEWQTTGRNLPAPTVTYSDPLSL